jgi:2-polyprenyl-3-methyl-5-hydroxy-6-metoxy-1,4-benzoquinol methylase
VKKAWLQHLCDPYDGSDLSLTGIAREDNERVYEATLVSATGRRYPVRNGIPAFLTLDFQAKESVESFAYEWNQFGFDFAKEGWLADICRPLVDDDSFFRGKTVVDAGAGSGAQTRWMAEGGAALIFSLELSDVIHTRHKQTIAGFEDRVFAIQCDIARPPLRTQVDVLYCMNVIQHTADPPATLRSLRRLLRPGGLFLFNIYTKRSEAKFRTVALVRALIRPLPFPVWKALAFLITAVAWPLSQIGLKRIVKSVVPISHSFRETWLDTYDAFGGHWYQKNMTVEDQKKMIDRENLDVVRHTTFGYLLRPRE